MPRLPQCYGFLQGLQSSLLRVADDPLPRRPLGERIRGLFTGDVPGFDSIFAFKYLIYWVEVFVILSIVLLVLYAAHSLNLFKRES